MQEDKEQSKLSRRKFLEAGSAVLVAAAGMQSAQGQQSKIYPTDPHTGINESQPGPKNNTVLDGQAITNLLILANGNITIDGVTLQSISFPPPGFLGAGALIDSNGNGVSISNAIFRNITGADFADSAGVRVLVRRVL